MKYKNGTPPWKLCLAVILLVMGICNVQTFGADANSLDSDELLDMSIEDLMDVEIVSVSRRAQSLNRSSAQVTVITAEDIHYSGLTNIPEILRMAPGVDVQRLDRSRYVVSVRGFQGRISDRILVLINGRSAGNPVLAGINWESLPVMIEDIDRIEIVRGPGGGAWGANAENGVINIITKEPVETEGLFLSSTLTEYGDSYTHVRISEVSDLWSWRLSTGYEDIENSDKAGAGKFTSSKSSLNSLIGFSSFTARDFSRNWRSDFEARRQYSEKTQLSFGVAHSHLQMGDSEFVGYFPMKDNLTNYTRIFSRINHEFENGNTGYIQWFSNHFVSHAPNTTKRYSYLENDIEAQYNLAPFNGHEISFGSNIRFNRIHVTNGPDIEETRFHSAPYSEQLFGLFVTDRFNLTDRLTIENQVRTDHYSETDYDWSLRSTLLYSLDEASDHTLRLSFARAFRNPSVALRDTTSSYIETAPGSNTYLFNTFRPTKDLVNEDTWSIEGGYTGLLGNGFSLNMNTYYQRYENILGVINQTTGPITNSTFSNNDGANAYGGELELALKREKYRVSAWYAYNALHTDKYNEVIRAAYPANNKAGLNTRLHIYDDFVFNASYTYYNSIRQYKNIVVDTPASNRLDMNLSRKIAGGKGEIMIGVTDVLNKASEQVFGVGDFTAHETPGRTFFTRLQLNF